MPVLRDTDRAQIDSSYSNLQALTRIAGEFLEREMYLHAAAAAQIAARYGSYNHPGEFVSAQLEHVLRGIGRDGLRSREPRVEGRRPLRGAPPRVLHVLTAAKDIGGDSRFVWRWIERDSERRHSVALTEQLYFEVPEPLSAAVAARNGGVHVLDRGGANALQRAQALRDLATDVDIVFLHVYVEDIIPVIAFADRAALPPIVFVVQADHQFWIGVSVCDAFLHLRESGIALSERRRGIPRQRTALLSIPLEPPTRTLTRREAKKRLGLPEDAVLLLSIARAVKYTAIDGPSFPEAAERILARHPEALLMALGPQRAGSWEAVELRTGGRLRALGQRSDTAIFYQAADIYLDSFPFSSNTSLLEAGGYGIPLVSYFPYSSDSDVLGPGSPGLDGTLIRATDLVEYEESVSRLIESGKARLALGRKTRHCIRQLHSGEAWQSQVDRVYRAVAQMALDGAAVSAGVPRRPGETDHLLMRLYAGQAPLGRVIGWYGRHLPYHIRVRLLRKMMCLDRTFSFSMFLPGWLNQRVASRLKGWRRLPGMGRLLGATK